jgi:hypothetical protein
MPSFLHETLLVLFRNRPVLAAEVLRDMLGVAVPVFHQARLAPNDLTEVVPREHRADEVVLLASEDGLARLGIVVEAQLSRDDDKAYAWPAYVASVRSSYRCSACVLVVTTDSAVAAWSARPIELGPCGSVLRPLVLGPNGVPVITQPEQARARPELAVLSAMAHGRSAAGIEIATAALAAVAGLDEERATLYGDVVLSCLGEAARRALEAMMASGNYEYQTEFVRNNVAKGMAKARSGDVLTVLEARTIAVPDEVRQRVQASTDLDELDQWLRRAAVVGSAAEIFNGQ